MNTTFYTFIHLFLYTCIQSFNKYFFTHFISGIILLYTFLLLVFYLFFIPFYIIFFYIIDTWNISQSVS